VKAEPKALTPEEIKAQAEKVEAEVAAAKAKEAAAAAAAAEAARIAQAIEDAKAPMLRAAEKIKKEAEQVKAADDVRLGAMQQFAALCKADDHAANEPYLVAVALPEVINRFDDKSAAVRAAAIEAVDALLAVITPSAVKSLTHTLFRGLEAEAKWRVKETCLNIIGKLTTIAPAQVSALIPEIVPLTNGLLWDTKKEVKDAALNTINKVVAVVDNRDIKATIPRIVHCMQAVDDVPECIQTLASVTFVQTVDEGTLGLLCPLLVRGFDVKKTAVKRQCAVIINNMSKLVENPSDAAPFLPTLLPALERASEEISDPEARAVAAKAREQLVRIRDAAEADKIKNAGQDPAFVRKIISTLVANKEVDDKFSVTLDYVSALSASLSHHANFDAAVWSKHITPYLAAVIPATAEAVCTSLREKLTQQAKTKAAAEDDNDGAEELCNCRFTLAYGSKILLHNTDLKLKRGYKYGLLGGNDSGKTSLMRAIANCQIEGFPDRSVLRSVFVEADIQGEMSHLACIDYIMADERIRNCGASREDISEMLQKVGFTEKMVHDGVSTLSGGWRMKLALARAMLQKADCLLMDEPTNHLDVLNVAWVKEYINSLKTVTCIMVSHDKGLLNDCCTHILSIKDLKLHLFKGNLSAFVAINPSAQSFFDFKATKLKFKFPNPGFLQGVKSKGRALMKMSDVTFTYPTNTKPTLSNVTVQVSLGSRVACVGVNGAGKSTMVKLLTGELEPQSGTVWKHPGTRVAYVAQHAFHHIENHLTKSANEYIRWRYQFGEDKEGLEKVTMVITEEEEAKLKTPVVVETMDDAGNVKKDKRVIDMLTGVRRMAKSGHEYEVSFVGMPVDKNVFMSGEKLETLGFTKHIKIVDAKVEAREGMYARPLTQDQVEQHLEDVGLDREFGTHNRMAALSGGQKVKVVLAAAMWNQPHIVILDEPTNYLDRESLGALAGAIQEYEGGVVMITHNNEFCSALCPETWVVEHGRLDCRGDPEWMKTVMNEKTSFVQLEEMVDGNGNVVKIKAKKEGLTRNQKKVLAKKKAAARERGEIVSSDEEDD